MFDFGCNVICLPLEEFGHFEVGFCPSLVVESSSLRNFQALVKLCSGRETNEIRKTHYSVDFFLLVTLTLRHSRSDGRGL